MKRFVAIAAFAIGLTGIALADDAISARQELMKQNGAATKVLSGMARDTTPFDLDKARAALAVYVSTSEKAPTLFPDTSQTGGETSASPKIWQSKADFESRFAKFGADARAAQTNIIDAASLKAQLPGLLKNCGSCHEDYRVKQD